MKAARSLMRQARNPRSERYKLKHVDEGVPQIRTSSGASLLGHARRRPPVPARCRPPSAPVPARCRPPVPASPPPSPREAPSNPVVDARLQIRVKLLKRSCFTMKASSFLPLQASLPGPARLPVPRAAQPPVRQAQEAQEEEVATSLYSSSCTRTPATCFTQ